MATSSQNRCARCSVSQYLQVHLSTDYFQGQYGSKSLCRKAEIAVDRVRTISKQRLKKKIDTLSKSEGAQLRKLITDMYGE